MTDLKEFIVRVPDTEVNRKILATISPLPQDCIHTVIGEIDACEGVTVTEVPSGQVVSIHPAGSRQHVGE